MKSKKIIYPIVAGIVCFILAVALIIGNVACYLNANIITSYLCGYGLDEDGEEAKAARESGNALAATVEENGAVLLKNQNNTLPLKNKKVNVFGWTGSDGGFIPQGTGSGTGSRNDLVTFLGGLKEAGIEYNETLIKAYDDLNWNRVAGGSYVIEAHGQRYDDFYGITEAPESFYTDELMENAKDYSDTAIIVLGRLMGEGNDYSKKQYISTGDDDETRKMQAISAREEYMIDLVTANFANVIVITNTTNPMELGFADDEKIDAVLHMGMPGTRGTIGVANLLSGKANPSGRLADTWAYDLSTAASYATAGFEGPTTYKGTGRYYDEYREDIYSGYYWYETADKEGFWDSAFAKERWNLKNGYEDVVQYPFGYGLSYTTFDWVISSANVSEGSVLTKDGKVEIEVKVQNTGDVAGKDVVELYYEAPYTVGGIEKSAIKLGAYAKTAELEPGKFQTLKLEMDVEEMKSYDCYDRNNNGFMGYELEKGEYKLSLRTDVHTPKATMDGVNSYTVRVNDDIRYETDSVTGEKVENQFTTYTNPTSGASSTTKEENVPAPLSIDGSENPGGPVAYMTRADFIGTFPVDKGEQREGEKTITLSASPTPEMLDEEEGIVPPKSESKETNWTLGDLMGFDYESPEWDELVSQLSIETCAQLIAQGGFATPAISSIGYPGMKMTDGPSGFNTNVTGGNNLKAVNYPCDTVLAQTWDWYMAYQVGVAIGIEGDALGLSGWYGPGANLHRSPMGGRNFEYYSEDALLAGITCAYHVLGAKEKGVVAFIKHIGPNEDDANRGRCQWLTEQSYRENYLKPFELAVKIGKTNGIMACVTASGAVDTYNSNALLTNVVRTEWGFRGAITTDYYSDGAGNYRGDQALRAGISQFLNPDGRAAWLDKQDSPTQQKYIQMRAKDMLYAYATTKFYAETAQGLENGALIGETQEVFAWWVPLLVGVDVLSVGLMALWITLSVRSTIKKRV